MITNIPNIPLITFYADCVPLFFLDPVNRVVGVVHSGWRGTVAKIGARAIDLMKEKFNCNPENCLVAIGPCIEKRCFNVGEEVIEEFKRVFYNWKEFCNVDNNNHTIDLTKANEIILVEAGVLKDNITSSLMCTKCNEELFFSHRRDNVKRGNLSAIIELK